VRKRDLVVVFEKPRYFHSGRGSNSPGFMGNNGLAYWQLQLGGALGDVNVYRSNSHRDGSPGAFHARLYTSSTSLAFIARGPS